MARDDTARENDKETSLLDRRSYLRLAGSAAASVGLFGTSTAAAQDGNVVFEETFTDSSYGEHFSNKRHVYEHDQITTDEARSDGSCLQVDIDQGNHYGFHGISDPKDVGKVDENLQEMYVSYWVKFSSDFETSSNGGKLPGPRNRELTNGGGAGVVADGTNGWTARGRFGDGGDGIDVGYYSYHMDMSGSWGDHINAGTVSRGEWAHVEQYVKLNTVSGGQANPDGELKMWVNGNLGIDRTDMRFTLHPENGINFDFIVYYGGSASSPANNQIFFDRLKVAKSIPSNSGSTSSGDTQTGEETEDGSSQNGTVLELVTDSGTESLTYDFTVDGSVQKRTNAGEISAESNDDITDNGDGTMAVSGISGMGQGDSYFVDGSITSMALDESKWTIRFGGEEMSVADLTRSQDSSQDDSLSKTIVIDGSIRPNVGSSYSFTVSGDVEKNDKLGSVQSNDTIAGSEVSGRVWGGKDAFSFSGEITSLTVDGNTTVSVGGVSSASADGGSLPKKLVIDGSDYPRIPTKYNVSVSGEAQKSSLLGSIQQNDDVSGGNLSGRVWGGKDGFRYSGEINSVTLDGPDVLRAGDDV